MKSASRIVPIIAIALVMVGCGQKKSMYHWGSYQGVVHDMYVTPENMPPAMQITKLNEDIEQAAANGQKVPPGLYAHLGMAYAAQGQPEKAAAALKKEQALFPESTTLITTLLRNADMEASQQ